MGCCQLGVCGQFCRLPVFMIYVCTVCSYGNTTGHTVTLGLTKTALAPASNKSRSAQIQATPRAPLYPMPVGRRSACPPGQIPVFLLLSTARAFPALPCVLDPVARPLAAVGPRTTICMYSWQKAATRRGWAGDGRIVMSWAVTARWPVGTVSRGCKRPASVQLSTQF